MKQFRYIASILVAFLITTSVFAQDMISVKDAIAKLKDPNVVLVSARQASQYSKIHINGAINIYPGELNNDSPVKSTIKKPSEIAKILGDKGISEKNEIIIYCNKGTNAGRLYWILKYMGAENVKVLDGHLDAWKNARKPITKKPSTRPATTFNVNLQKEYAARMVDVKKAIGDPNVVIIDARSAEEFAGTDDTELRKGHIPSAINIPNTDLMTAKHVMKGPETLKALFESKGVTPDKTVIIYCKSSYRAGIEFLALKSILNYPNVKVYDGAFFEWEAVAANTVEK